MELDEAERAAALLAKPGSGVAWEVHTDFSRRAAIALAGNDLRGALHAAELAVAALRSFEAQHAREIERELKTIGNENPHAGHGTRPA